MLWTMEQMHEWIAECEYRIRPLEYTFNEYVRYLEHNPPRRRYGASRKTRTQYRDLISVYAVYDEFDPEFTYWYLEEYLCSDGRTLYNLKRV